MAFLNTSNAITIDKSGNIYSFKLIKSGIELIVHEKFTGHVDKSIIVEGEIEEYDVTIDQDDKIDLICKRKDKSLSIYSLNDGKWIESKIYEDDARDTCGLKIISASGKLNIFYYMLSSEDKGKISIYHHYLKEGNWNTNIVKDIYRSDIIKPIEVIEDNNSLLIAYYDLGNYSEDIFINRFNVDNYTWEEPVNITRDNKFKLYLDILKVGKSIHIAYSEYEDENLIVQYKQIKLEDDKYIGEYQDVLSNHANCTYPTFVSTGDILWTVWTEYENVASVYSKDGGETWSNPYIWSESKNEDFARYKFINNEDSINGNYKMNYSFSKTYPNLSLLGFGDLSGSVESFKKKEESDDMIKKDQDYENTREFENTNELEIKLFEKIDRKINSLEKEIVEIQKKLQVMDRKFKNTEVDSLDKRINDIENTIYRRRNPFSSRT